METEAGLGAAVALPRQVPTWNSVQGRQGVGKGHCGFPAQLRAGLEPCGKVGAPLAPGAVPITVCLPQRC